MVERIGLYFKRVTDHLKQDYFIQKHLFLNETLALSLALRICKILTVIQIYSMNNILT